MKNCGSDWASIHQSFHIFPQVELKSETWAHLIGYVKHLVNMEFMRVDASSTLDTLRSLMMILEVEKHVPADLQKAVETIQEIAADRKDSGLGAIIVGLSQGKALLRQAHSHVDDTMKDLEFLNQLSGPIDKVATMSIPNEKVTDWANFSSALNEGIKALSEALPKVNNESAKGVINQAKKTLSDFAVALCKSYASFIVDDWVAMMLGKWDSEDGDCGGPPELGCSTSGGVSNLGATASEHVSLTLELASAMKTVYEIHCLHKAKKLETKCAINASKKIEDFMSATAPRMVVMTLFSDGTPLSKLKQSMMAISDARVAIDARDLYSKLANVVAKACFLLTFPKLLGTSGYTKLEQSTSNEPNQLTNSKNNLTNYPSNWPTD